MSLAYVERDQEIAMGDVVNFSSEHVATALPAGDYVGTSVFDQGYALGANAMGVQWAQVAITEPADLAGMVVNVRYKVVNATQEATGAS
jgi:hypothetical protein